MNGLKNWYYKNLIEFLKFFGFSFSHQKVGSHEVWINDQKRKVELYNSNNEKAFPPGALLNILKRAGINPVIAKKWTRIKKGKKKIKLT